MFKHNVDLSVARNLWVGGGGRRGHCRVGNSSDNADRFKAHVTSADQISSEHMMLPHARTSRQKLRYIDFIMGFEKNPYQFTGGLLILGATYALKRTRKITNSNLARWPGGMIRSKPARMSPVPNTKSRD
jgi:hypothetical protein